MKVERNFNKRSAPLVDVSQPHVSPGGGDALGVAVTIFPVAPDRLGEAEDVGCLRMHLTPAEAIEFGLNLVSAARTRLKQTGNLG